ncbi:MAG TPA: hypothetical protein VGO49_20735 [Bradyrhizobium sp.]|jgi:hypothetical protein|nr:hypothetical protein [Bradyrhizobium sp.]
MSPAYRFDLDCHLCTDSENILIDASTTNPTAFSAGLLPSVAFESRFWTPPESAFAALKNLSKIPFIQQLDRRDFALGAMRLSWHKWQRFSLAFFALIRRHPRRPLA